MAAEMHRRIHGGRHASEKEGKIESAISTFDCIFVDFYAPWCGHGMRLNPELNLGLIPPEAAERKRSRGGFLNLFDWSGKSRKKLFKACAR